MIGSAFTLAPLRGQHSAHKYFSLGLRELDFVNISEEILTRVSNNTGQLLDNRQHGVVSE